MDGLRAVALEAEINKQLKERAGVIEEIITRGCKDTDRLENLFVKMMYNAIELSVGISTGLVIDMLIERGLADPLDEEQLRKNILSVMK